MLSIVYVNEDSVSPEPVQVRPYPNGRYYRVDVIYFFHDNGSWEEGECGCPDLLSCVCDPNICHH